MTVIEEVKTEVIIEPNVDRQAFEKAYWDIKVEAKNTKKELDKNLLFELVINKTKLKNDLDEVNKQLREAKKWNDEQAILELQLKKEQLTQALKDASKELTNFQNTGNKSLSQTWSMFEQLGNKIVSVSNIIKTKLISWLLDILANLWKSIVNQFLEIDKAQAELVKSTGASWAELEGYMNSAIKVFWKWKESLNEVAVVVAEVNTRFWITGDMLEWLSPKIIDFADVLWIDTKTAVEKVDFITKQWWLTLQETAWFMDAVTRAWQLTWISTESLVSSIIKFWPELRLLNYSLGDSISLFSQLEKNWIDTDAVFAGLKKWVANLAKETGQSLPDAFNQVINSIKNATTEQEAFTIATEYFWTKTWAQMSEAIRNNSFALDEMNENLKISGSVYSMLFNKSSLPLSISVMINSPNKVFCHANHGLVKFLGSSLWKDSCIKPVPASVSINIFM